MQFARKTGLLLIFIISSVISLGAAGQYQQDNEGDLYNGAHLYQAWDKRVGANLLGYTNPMWEELERKGEPGPVTWRCSSCHGWNYLGTAYNDYEGGFVPGLLTVRTMENEEIQKWLDGTNNPKHDFSAFLTIAAQKDLIYFLKHGLINYTSLTKQKIFATTNISGNGEELYKESCRDCHGPDGARINFGTAENPAFLGNSAEEPWKVVHLIQFGHPNVGVPPAENIGWRLEDVTNVVKYTIVLPKGQQLGNDVEPISDVDYSTQADTAQLVYAAFIAVLVVIFGIGWSNVRGKLKFKR